MRHVAVSPTASPTAPLSSARRRRRSCTVATAASTSAPGAYSNPLGVHALVFTGDWSEGSAKAAAAGARAAGFDLVRRRAQWRGCWRCTARSGRQQQLLPRALTATPAPGRATMTPRSRPAAAAGAGSLQR